jgi:hypothetical protein
MKAQFSLPLDTNNEQVSKALNGRVALDKWELSYTNKAANLVIDFTGISATKLDMIAWHLCDEIPSLRHLPSRERID